MADVESRSAEDAFLTSVDDRDGEAEEAPTTKGKPVTDRTLLIAFVIMVAVGIANNILRVLQFGPMQPYALTVNVLTTFIYLPPSFGWVWWKWDKLTDEEKAIPWYKWAIMGCLDSIAGILQSLGVAFVSQGTLVILLLQSAIPISMIFTRLLTPKRYKLFNYAGAVAVIGGIAIVLVPKIVEDHTSGGNAGSLLEWSLVLVVSCVPMALSSVYKEVALGSADCDVWHMNGQVALYQLIASFVLLYPSAMAESIAPANLWSNFGDGFRCLAGINSSPTDVCSSAPYLVSAYCVANLGYNVMIVYLLKIGGSNLLWMCLTAMVPLASLFFSLPFVPAINRSTIDAYTLIGLIVILSGLGVYRFWHILEPALRRAGLLCACCDACCARFSGRAPTDAVPGRDDALTREEGDYMAVDLPGAADETELTLTHPGVQTSPGFASTPARGMDAVHVPRRKRNKQLA